MLGWRILALRVLLRVFRGIFIIIIMTRTFKIGVEALICPGFLCWAVERLSSDYFEYWISSFSVLD